MEVSTKKIESSLLGKTSIESTELFRLLIMDDSLGAKDKIDKLSIQDAVSLYNPHRIQISGYKDNRTDLLLMIMKLLRATMKYFGSNLEGDTAVEISKLICEEYWFLTLEDVALAFKNAKIGKYRFESQFEERFNASSVFRWLKMYNKERDEYIELERQKEHANKKSEKTEIEWSSQDMYKNACYKRPEKRTSQMKKASALSNIDNKASFEAEKERQLKIYKDMIEAGMI